jgi:hypothetical protein
METMQRFNNAFLLACSLSIVNLLFWHLGMLMNHGGGAIDYFGARLCAASRLLAVSFLACAAVLAATRAFRGPIWFRLIPALLAGVSLAIIEIELSLTLRE